MSLTVLSKTELFRENLAFLRENVTCVLSWTSLDGRSQSATVFFWVNDVTDTTFKVFFVTRRHTRKFGAITRNPWVSMVVGSELAPTSVQIEGQAVPMEATDGLMNLEELTVRLKAKPQLQMLYGGAFVPRNPFPDLEGEDFVVMRVTVSWVRFMHRDPATQALRLDEIFP